MLNRKVIKEIIRKLPFVNGVTLDNSDSLIMNGTVQIYFDKLAEPLTFEFQIRPSYPLKTYGSESITFFNKSLLEYSHVMENGAICIHTSYETSLEKKLKIDFNSLKSWIELYYIAKERDQKYEHIIVNKNLFNDQYFSYMFTDVNYRFKKYEYGEVILSRLNNGLYNDLTIENYIVKHFKTSSRGIVPCQWSTHFKQMPVAGQGFYLFVEDQPATYNKFIYTEFKEFEDYFPSEFLTILHNFENTMKKKYSGEIIPIFIGYNTIKRKIHWEIMLWKIGSFPIKGIADKIDGKKTGKWQTVLENQSINWGISNNSSYNLFFGRGALAQDFTNSKILIIGVGAIGSILAKLLTRGGCRQIDIADYDHKEPGNVCRSEYTFDNGVQDKVYELRNLLISTSPFLEINIFNKDYFDGIIKSFSTNHFDKEHFSTILNEYDIVFDCSTDNDLMYVLDSLDLKCQLINLSITNHAQSLVCAFSPNIFHFVDTQYTKILDNDLSDLFEPTGCWNPTFKASYSDIAFLVHMTIKQINNNYLKKRLNKNFVIRTNDNDVFEARITEF